MLVILVVLYLFVMVGLFGMVVFFGVFVIFFVNLVVVGVVFGWFMSCVGVDVLRNLLGMVGYM